MNSSTKYFITLGIIVLIAATVGGLLVWHQKRAAIKQTARDRGEEIDKIAITQHRAYFLEMAKQESSPGGVPSAPAPRPATASHIVLYGLGGYRPAALTVTAGDTVSFINDAGMDTDPGATAIHGHTDMRMWPMAKNLADPARCGAELFNSCGAVEMGGAWTFMFSRPGTLHYVDHLNPAHAGTIVVE